MICDHDARLQALDPVGSFIVQAPAGSGKTELLTQRFLKLLTTVSEPEEILAVTFTRKAAGEMRHRIIQALAKASQGSDLVRAVADRNQTLKWRLIENPNRLRIMTIDALCSTIAHQMPLLSQSGGKFEITTDPKIFYSEAVEKCLLMTTPNDPWNEALKIVLMHFDNRVEKIKSVLALLLSKREQWLVHLAQIQQAPDELAAYFSDVLGMIVNNQLEKIVQALPESIHFELFDLISYAANNCVENDIDHPIKEWTCISEFPDASPESLDLWLGLVDFLLTKENQWRKQFIKTTGFLSPSTTTDKAEKILRKEKITGITNILKELSENNTLRDHLGELRMLPPTVLSQNQLTILTALGELLPVLVGFLKIVFKERGKVDFTEVTLSALHALGDDLAPTDIVLRLDYQLKHILIDEYQDTSVIQYKIFEKLVSGWQPGDGRTLFLVGDPMQSIYRFRGAEVNLFLRTREQGLGGIRLHPLQLKMNFRSNQTVVNWINQHFSKIFPSEVDYTLSAIEYSEAIAAHTGGIDKAVMLHPLLSEASDQEEYVADLIEKLSAESETGRIAVLVRARTHLAALIPVLKRRRIAFVAHEVEHLAKRPHVIDLITLLRATSDFTDKVAWLALLRSPLVGLNLADLLRLEQFEPNEIIWNKLKNQNIIAHSFIKTLSYWLENRQRAPLSHWIRGLWLVLGGLKCYPEAHLQKDFETIYYWINEFDQGGALSDIEAFEKKIDELYADVVPSDPLQSANIEIMTIHKAKGLEFDTVILPHCQANTGRNDPALLLWQEMTHPGGLDLIFAASRSSQEGADRLYDYINHLHKQKERHETARLFYVAASRAKKALHLIAEYERDEDEQPKPALKGSFWGMLMRAYSESLEYPDATRIPKTNRFKKTEHDFTIKRLRSGWQLPGALEERILEGMLNLGAEPNLPEMSDPVFRIIGTVFHRAMQGQVYLKPRENWEGIIKLALKRAGVPSISLQNALIIVLQALDNLSNDPKAQWIISPSQRDRRSEWALSVSLPHGVEHIIIDYAFIDESNVRWIVDYKLVQTQAFSKEAECEKYGPQLQRYSRALLKYEKRDVRTGLYFPLQQEWIELTEGKVHG